MAVVAARTERRTVSEGRRRAEKQKRPDRRPLLGALAFGALGSGLAWVFLVKAAIEFAWAFTAAAAVGATACLLLMFVLGARVLAALGLVSEYKPRRSAGRRTK